MKKEQTGLRAEKAKELREQHAPLFTKTIIRDAQITENPATLEASEVQEKCFQLLGFLEQYHQPGSFDEGVSFPEAKDLETELDAVLAEKKDSQKKDEEGKEEKKVDVMSHRTAIKQRILDILGYSQVRELFEKTFDGEEPLYESSRPAMREVKTCARLIRKLKQVIYRTYLDSKRKNGKLVQTDKSSIARWQEELERREGEKQSITDTANEETLGYLEMQKLLEYKRQMKQNGFVLTPSREQLIDRITREALAGKKIFLVGSTGTGKTQLAFYVLDQLSGGYEIIPWHEGTTPRDIFGYREIYEDEEGKVKSGPKPGPYPKALKEGRGLVHEEFTGGSTRTQLSQKYLMGAKPGQKVSLPGFNGQVFEVTENFIELFTGNPKDARTKQREEMDPAILRELTGVEVGYMPAEEMRDIILAQLIEKNGVLLLSREEVNLIEKLCHVAEMMQQIHNGVFDALSPEIKTAIGIDAHGKGDVTLNTNFLDPGTLFKLFGEWELARARGQKFSRYLEKKLEDFIADPKTLSVPEEKKTIQKILQLSGCISLAMGGITVEEGKFEKSYILPSEMGFLQGEKVVRSGYGEEKKDSKKKGEGNISEQEAREVATQKGVSFLGQKEWLDTHQGIRFPDKPSLPAKAEIEKGIEELQQVTDGPLVLVYIPEEVEIEQEGGTWKKIPFTMQLLHEGVAPKIRPGSGSASDPLKKMLNDTDGYQNENFYTQQTVPSGYYLLSLGALKTVDGHFTDGMSFTESDAVLEAQKRKVSESLDTPMALMIATALEMHYAQTGTYELKNKYLWCQDTASAVRRVNVGAFDSRGLSVVRCRGGRQNAYLGRAVSRKFSKIGN